MQVQRYGFGLAGPHFGPSPSGSYVKLEDFNRILAERDALQQRLNVADEALSESTAKLDKAESLAKHHLSSISDLEDKVEHLRLMLPGCINCGGMGVVDDGHSSFECWKCDGLGVKREGN